MNRYDSDAPRQQGYGGTQGHDAPRQANQWQADQNNQPGNQSGGWGHNEGQHSYRRDERYGNAGSGDPMGDIRDGSGQEGNRDTGRSGYGSLERAYRADPRNDGRNEWRNEYQGGGDWLRGASQVSDRHQRGDWGHSGYRNRFADRYYDAGYPTDYSSFTSEDFGGRDFSARRGGASRGFSSSDTYRPSYGLSRGDWTGFRSGSDASADYGNWRDYGEQRGFMERAGDEIASWFGDEDAARRREQDHRGRGPSDYTRSDERIREDANDRLTHDWRVDASHIRVAVKDGEVTLDGTVESRTAKRRAEDVVDGVSGVRHVQNNLRVQDATSKSTTTPLSGTTGTTATGGQSTTAATGTGATKAS